MIIPQPRRTLVLLTTALALVSPTVETLAADPPPGRVSRYDLATRDDLLFAHLVEPFLEGDVASWPILGGLSDQLGTWITRYVDAQRIANLISEAFPVEGQPPLRPLDRLVAECAATLGVAKPALYVRNDPYSRIYVVQASRRYHLVVTSGLLDLYAERPEELKFVVGRELGHILCGHPELRSKCYGLLEALKAINVAAVPDRYQAVLPTLGLGRLLTWSREAEISADRAGLLCCGEPKAAFQAIMRLQHGLAPNSPWIDPESPDFDAEAVIRNFRQWQYQPFVSFLLDLKRHQLEVPYVAERLAMLKGWADSDAYRAILARPPGPGRSRLFEVVAIQAFELAPEGQVVDPYVIGYDGDRRFLWTVYATSVREAQWQSFRGKGVDQPRGFRDGQPLFFEVWDSNYGPDTLLGGFVVYPDGREAKAGRDGNRLAVYTAKLQWDWKEPQPVSRPGYARVQVRFLDRPTAAGRGGEATQGAKRWGFSRGGAWWRGPCACWCA